MNDIELAYLGVEVADVPALETVLADIVGLVSGDPAGEASTWRNDEKTHRILVTEGPADDASVLGFELRSVAELDATVERLRSLGHTVEKGSPSQSADRRVDVLWATTSPWGTPIELVVGLADSPVPFDSPLMPGGFKTKGVGFGHTIAMTMAVGESHQFVTEGLGLELTDTLVLVDLFPGITVRGSFYHGNPRHHTLAVIGAPDERMHHFMVETTSVDNVGMAFDRAHAAGIPIVNGIGRHDNDRMFSFYLETPAGFQIEVGYGGAEIGPDWDSTKVYDRISAWGHQPIARPSIGSPATS